MKRNIQLDFLRLCGVFLVMINHLHTVDHSILGKLFYNIRVGGWIGVDLFFVLSGYLVSGLIFNEYKLNNSFDFPRFLIRRGFKIYPTYYVFIFFSFFFFTDVVNVKSFTLEGLLHECIFISNYFSFNNVHLWSICVEEHFYLLLALTFFALVKIKANFRAFFVIYLALLLIGLCFRLFNYINYPNYDFVRDYTKSHYRLDALFFGVILSYATFYHQNLINLILFSKGRMILIVLSLLFLSTNFLLDRASFRWVAVVNLALNPVCFGLLMLNIINYNNALFLKLIEPLAYLGKYSYSIYLFHPIFNLLAVRLVTQGYLYYYFAYFLMTIAGGIIISKCIEYPFLNFREKHFPSTSKQSGIIIARIAK